MSSQASPTETADACPRGPAAGTVPASPVMQGPGLWSLLSFVQPPLTELFRAAPSKAAQTPLPPPRGPQGFLPGLLCSSLEFAVCIFFFPLFKSQAKGKR